MVFLKPEVAQTAWARQHWRAPQTIPPILCESLHPMSGKEILITRKDRKRRTPEQSVKALAEGESMLGRWYAIGRGVPVSQASYGSAKSIGGVDDTQFKRFQLKKDDRRASG